MEPLRLVEEQLRLTVNLSEQAKRLAGNDPVFERLLAAAIKEFHEKATRRRRKLGWDI